MHFIAANFGGKRQAISANLTSLAQWTGVLDLRTTTILPDEHTRHLPTMALNMSLFSVNAILILSNDDSSRILVKYYSPPHIPHNAQGNNYPGANPYPSVKDQKAFEKGLLEKTAKQTTDVILYDNKVVVFKMESDVMLYVVGGADENEIMLYNVILALRDSLNILLKYAINKVYDCPTMLTCIQKLRRQAHTDRELRPSVFVYRRDRRRRHHSRDRPGRHRKQSQQAAGAGYAQHARH